MACSTHGRELLHKQTKMCHNNQVTLNVMFRASQSISFSEVFLFYHLNPIKVLCRSAVNTATRDSVSGFHLRRNDYLEVSSKNAPLPGNVRMQTWDLHGSISAMHL